MAIVPPSECPHIVSIRTETPHSLVYGIAVLLCAVAPISGDFPCPGRSMSTTSIDVCRYCFCRRHISELQPNRV